MSENQRTELSDFGEFSLIDHLTKTFENRHITTVRGVGDDAAVIDQMNGNFSLLSTDLLIEGVHFDLTYVPLKHLGYKAVVVNLSDIFAMNGIPKQLTCSLAVSNRFSVEALEELYLGVKMACDKYDVDLVGGDTSSSTSGLTISISVLGECPEDKVVYRSGAQLGDLICVSGDLGAAYLGLQLLEREKQVFMADENMQPELKGMEYMLARQLKPEARGDVIAFLEDNNLIPSAMIDVSDGLSSDILHIAQQSNLGVLLEEEAIPIQNSAYQTAIDLKHDPMTCALNGGEDYELLFCIHPMHKEIIDGHHDISIVGQMTDAEHGFHLLTKQGNVHALKAQGWKSH